jgi:hypothetical protein
MEYVMPFSIREVHERHSGRGIGKKDQRFVIEDFSIKTWGAKTIHQESMSTLGGDTHGWSSHAEACPGPVDHP